MTSTLNLRRPARPGSDADILKKVTSALVKKYASDKKEADAAVKEFGLTIEVTKLLDAVDRAARTELQRLLVETPGVVEKLFLEATKDKFDEARDHDDDIVKDSSIDNLGDALSEIRSTLQEMLKEMRAGQNGQGGNTDGVPV